MIFNVEETIVPFHTADRWQWAWKPQGPVLAARHLQAALKRGIRAWDRRRWAGLTGAEPPVGEPEYRQYLREVLWAIADRRLSDAETEAVVDRFLKAPVARDPPPDLAPTLQRLRREGMRVAVLGERPGPLATEELRRSGSLANFDHVAGAKSDAPWPPRKEAFRGACAELGLHPKEVVFVGHLFWSEVRAAHRAGLSAYLLDRNDWWPKVSERRVRALTDLPASFEAPPDPAVPPEVGGPGEDRSG
ncbi:MAG TPA: HAD family hydrolase [Thermoplasmata archaeon]|nr:HAD family hydrolase [Thermoplasmata archaeon]